MDEYTRENYIQYIKDAFQCSTGRDSEHYKVYLEVSEGIFKSESVENSYQQWMTEKKGVTYEESIKNYVNALNILIEKYK